MWSLLFVVGVVGLFALAIELADLQVKSRHWDEEE